MSLVSVAVMAHPKREAFVPGILAKLDAPAEVVWDEHNDRWDTGRRSMLAHDPAATHHLVVQDDAVLCHDLVAGLSRAIEHVPNNPISLYLGRNRPRPNAVESRAKLARAAGQAWVAFQGPWWGVGVCVPVRAIKPMLAWCDKRPEIANYDRRMSRYFASVGVDCFHTVPSLVDHRQDHESLVPGRVTLGRRAHWFIGTKASALDVDWSKLPVPADNGYVSTEAGYVCWYCNARSKSERQIRMHVAYAHMGWPLPPDEAYRTFGCADCANCKSTPELNDHRRTVHKER